MKILNFKKIFFELNISLSSFRPFNFLQLNLVFENYNLTKPWSDSSKKSALHLRRVEHKRELAHNLKIIINI